MQTTMKRLLIASLFLGLIPSVHSFPFKKDFIFKTDVGEKYIIKEKTIKISTDENKDKLLNSIKQELDYQQKPILKALDDIKYKWENSDQLIKECKSKQSTFSLGINNVEKSDMCEDKYANFIEMRQKKYDYGQDLENLEEEYAPKIKVLNDEKESNIYKIFEFTPIYQDLNKTKIVMGKEYVFCLNPEINSSTIMYISEKIKIPDYQSLKVEIYDDLKKRICDKYALF